MKIIFPVISAIFIFYSCSSSKKTAGRENDTSDILVKLLNQYSTVYPEFDSVLQRKDELKVQIIYTQIDRDNRGNPIFKDFYFNNNDSNYFYPASTVKLPVAVLALQKLNQLNIQGLNKNTMMITGEDGDGQTVVNNDSTSADGRPTIGHYIKRILLVSDNDAFNRLYEFLGQEYINNSLHEMGYEATQIIHRLDISLTEQQNRHTNPVRFYDGDGKLVYEKPAEKSQFVYAIRNTKIGRGYMKGDSIVNEPLDFSKKNRLLLKDLHNIVRSVMFPQSVPDKQRFNLTPDDYNFLRRYMSMTPPESTDPSYDSSYHASYVKYLFYGGEKGKTRPDIRIFNKVGDAYGFLVDASYFADFDHHVEFMLSAVIYCNSDGILNDDKYDYQALGLPFMKHLGWVIYEHEGMRKRAVIPDLSTFRFNYTK